MIFSLVGCVTLQAPKITVNDDLDSYKYVVIPDIDSVSSGNGSVYGNQYGVYGGSYTKEVNPASVIEGILLKHGIISVSEVAPEDASETLLLRYGQSGKRDVMGGLGYTLEVTIVMLSANTKNVVYSCVAEGIGDTEVDDIRDAIHRCLSGI